MRDNKPIVVKVGGSLFDMPDLGGRLSDYLSELAPASVLLVPGGGGLVEQVRNLHKIHGLREEDAHWLALHGMALTARFLAHLVAGALVVPSLQAARDKQVAILDALAFCRDQPDALPATWELTSDSIALAVALQARARQLILLKSAKVPEGMDWEEAGRRGFVDSFFARLNRLAPGDLAISAVNLRTWRPSARPARVGERAKP